MSNPGFPSRQWIPKPRGWPKSTDWAQVAAGHRWRRRWGNLGAEVVRRSPTQWPVRITPLGPDRAAVGEPVELVSTARWGRRSSTPTSS